ncbi:hypothetical protein NDU88_004496 [Pleurodeles waltl]|uniref:Uncharacterized protein n=1 Tax=Pleurodeles waltl TaxID=8319 RepID=A0AAV7MGR8_PLEWA|nr:hypothetical protein NDU88_004496 [Pleurodeles waltl]
MDLAADDSWQQYRSPTTSDGRDEEAPLGRTLLEGLFVSLRKDIQSVKQEIYQDLRKVRRDLADMGTRVSTLEDNETVKGKEHEHLHQEVLLLQEQQAILQTRSRDLTNRSCRNNICKWGAQGGDSWGHWRQVHELKAIHKTTSASRGWRQLETAEAQLHGQATDRAEYDLLHLRYTFYVGGNKSGRLLAHKLRDIHQAERVGELLAIFGETVTGDTPIVNSNCECLL